MSRRTVLAAVTGAALLGGLVVPAVATAQDEAEYVCVRLIADPKDGKREGFCVWAPAPVRR